MDQKLESPKDCQWSNLVCELEAMSVHELALELAEKLVLHLAEDSGHESVLQLFELKAPVSGSKLAHAMAAELVVRLAERSVWRLGHDSVLK